MKNKTLLASCLMALGLATGLTVEHPAFAAPKSGGVITLGEIKIVGRVQKPVASVDVGKVPVNLTLAELRQPFLDRIEEAVQHDPF
jgi:hypothetical protein